ncbi:hypothetical protein F0562_007526 [Nyssa sinensis]|uniref:Nucleic acid binding NABP domain-containing protein n=1 Tax=Nyssa sinensis TaxID=561372 RepID=A0A5J5A8C2_9ASTE|nr:hypothetical protein F0562_007526 [Nyssa sinensis]
MSEALNDPSIDGECIINSYLDLTGLQKAYLGSLLSPQKSQIGLLYLVKSGSLNHGFYRNPAFGIGMPYPGSPLAGPLLPNSPIGLGSPVDLCERNMRFHEIIGHIVKFSADQYGSWFIQQKLETATTEEKNMVFHEIMPQALTLMTNVFAFKCKMFSPIDGSNVPFFIGTVAPNAAPMENHHQFPSRLDGRLFRLRAPRLTPSAQSRLQTTTGLIQSAAPKPHDPTFPSNQMGTKDSKALVVVGNGLAADSIFGDVFSTTSSQPKHGTLVPTSSASGLPFSSAIVPASRSQPIAKPRPLRSFQSTFT